jgi:hypothetical protein
MPVLSRFCCLLAIILAIMLAGCSAAGGYIGARRDAETNRTREFPIAQADRIPLGSVIYATPIRGETAKGIFRGVSDSAGIRSLRMDTGDGRENRPLDSLSALVAEVHGHKYLGRGLMIGAAIDVGVIGAGWLIAYLLVTNIHPVY